MKKIFWGLLILFLSLSMAPLSLANEVEGEINEDICEYENVVINERNYTYVKYRKKDHQTIQILGMKTEDTTLVIPDKIDGYDVVELGFSDYYVSENEAPHATSSETGNAMWQKENKRYKEVVIENGIKRLGKYSFEHILADCVVLPKSVEEVDYRAFWASDIKRAKVKGEKTTIGEECFGYSKIKNIDFSSNYSGKIQKGAFMYSDL